MFKKPRDFNAAECMIWMYINNPGKINIYMPDDYPIYLTSNVPVNQLIFPEHWYYSKETQTINKDTSNIRFSIVFKE